MRFKLKHAAVALLALITGGILATSGSIGVSVGPVVGERVGVAVGVSENAIGGATIPLILMFGDSQIPGEAATDAADPSFNVTVTQPTTFVQFDKHYAQSAADPPTYQTDVTGGVRPYAIGGVPGMGMEISIGQELSLRSIRAVLASFGIAGMTCAQSLPASTYPTTPPNVWTQVVARTHALEATYGARAKVALISAGNNDGANNTDATNLTANSATLAAALRAAFPGIQVSWIKINADTVNAAGFTFEGVAIASQATFFTNDPTIVSIFNDDRPLQSDRAHFTADTALTVGQRFVYGALTALGGTVPRPATFPVVVGWGPQMFSAGTATSPPSWGGAAAGDLEILVTASLTASGVNNALTTPAGWTLIGTTSSAGGGATTRAGFYRRVVDSTMITANHGFTAPTTVVAANTNEFSQILTIRGPTANPTVDVSALSVNNAFNNTLSLAGVTTTAANETAVIVNVAFRTNATANPVTITGTNLSGVTVVKNGTRDSGLSNFATIDVQTGTLAAAGPTGTGAIVYGQNSLAVALEIGVKP